MMNTQKWKGAGALKSLVAIITMAAVLVLTLPVFKLDAGAIYNIPTYDIEGLTLSGVDYDYSVEVVCREGTSEQIGFALLDNSLQGLSSTGNVASGKVLLLPAGIDFSEFIPNLSEYTEVAGNVEVPYTGGTSVPFIKYRFINSVAYSIDGFAVTSTGISTDNNTNTDSGTNITPASSPMQQMKAMNWAELLSQINAYLRDRDAALARQRADYESQQAKIAQANRDNLYFRNLNEAIRNGKSMVVFSDHSALRSQINGTYLANSVPGLAALFMGLPNPNLHIETWNITSRNAPDAVNAINGVAEQNGYTVGAMLQVNIGEKGSDGKPVYESTNKEPVANIVMGVPNSIRGDGAEYGAVQVLPGGEIHMYKDLPFNDNAVYLPLGIGRSAIGLVQTN